MINLFSEVPITDVHIGDALHSDAVVRTVARLIIERSDKPIAEVNPEGVQQVVDALTPWKPVTPDGKIIKRIRAWLFKTHNAQINDDTSARIAAYLGDDLPSSGFSYAITKQFDWKRGDFGDAGSCFFAGTMGLLSFSDAYALRFYNISSKKGAGRAIILPTSNAQAYIINSYGLSIEQTMNRLRIIDPESRFSIHHAVRGYGAIFVNLNACIVVNGPPLKTRDSVDINFVLPKPARHPITGMLVASNHTDPCACCGEPVLIRDIHATHDRQILCPDCLQAEAATCPVTWHTYLKRDMTLRMAIILEDGQPRATRKLAHTEPALLNRHFCPRCRAACHVDSRATVYIQGTSMGELCEVCQQELKVDNRCGWCGACYRGEEGCGCLSARRNRLMAKNKQAPGVQALPPSNPSDLYASTGTASTTYTHSPIYNATRDMNMTTIGPEDVGWASTEEVVRDLNNIVTRIVGRTNNEQRINLTGNQPAPTNPTTGEEGEEEGDDDDHFFLNVYPAEFNDDDDEHGP